MEKGGREGTETRSEQVQEIQQVSLAMKHTLALAAELGSSAKRANMMGFQGGNWHSSYIKHKIRRVDNIRGGKKWPTLADGMNVLAESTAESHEEEATLRWLTS